MNRPVSPLKSHILVVEGQSDKHVVIQISNRHQPIPSFCISDKDSIDQLLNAISLEVKEPGRQALGILVDANDNLTARWNSVADRLRRVGYQPPASPDPAGTVIPGNPHIPARPRIGIWLMPDNTSPGELEDFVAQMIPGEDPVWPLSQQYIEGIPAADRKFAEHKTLRAQIHAWLAARKDPSQMGLAIRAHDLDVDGPLCQKFVAWLMNLFG